MQFYLTLVSVYNFLKYVPSSWFPLVKESPITQNIVKFLKTLDFTSDYGGTRTPTSDRRMHQCCIFREQLGSDMPWRLHPPMHQQYHLQLGPTAHFTPLPETPKKLLYSTPTSEPLFLRKSAADLVYLHPKHHHMIPR